MRLYSSISVDFRELTSRKRQNRMSPIVRSDWLTMHRHHRTSAARDARDVMRSAAAVTGSVRTDVYLDYVAAHARDCFSDQSSNVCCLYRCSHSHHYNMFDRQTYVNYFDSCSNPRDVSAVPPTTSQLRDNNHRNLPHFCCIAPILCRHKLCSCCVDAATPMTLTLCHRQLIAAPERPSSA